MLKRRRTVQPTSKRTKNKGAKRFSKKANMNYSSDPEAKIPLKQAKSNGKKKRKKLN